MIDRGFGRAGVIGETKDGCDAMEEMDFCGDGPVDLRPEKCRGSGSGDCGGVGSASTRSKL